MTPEERAALCRRIASSGGKKTVERHGRDHMSKIGKRGFIAALESSGYSDAGHMISHWQELGKFYKPSTKDGRDGEG